MSNDIAIPEFLSGGGEMGERIRSYDWSKTSLGHFSQWPRSLRTCIRIMLTSRQPIWIGWGKELIKFYNDPYKAIVGGKHPEALGQPASVVWKEIWKDIRHMLEQVTEKDQGTYVESQLLIMERNGYLEETYYTFSYTPIPGDDGGTAGMICANTDDTERIISERQLLTLTELGKHLTDGSTEKQVFQNTIDVLARNPHDFPFALLYKCDNGSARIECTTDLGNSAEKVPALINLGADNELSRLMSGVAKQRKYEMLHGITEKIGMMPSGPWAAPPDAALILPITHAGQRETHGFLVVGMNPYRIPDPKYLNFFQLVSDQVATSINKVQRIEEERKRAEALTEIDRLKTIFFSNISHEFRTPLTLMLAPLEDVLNDPDTIEKNRQRAGIAHRNALRLLKLVNTLLDFSRIEAGKMRTSVHALDLPTITRDLASSFRSAIERAGIEYIVDCEPIDEPVYMDPDMWEKIVFNLISNAFKYTEQGKIEVRLKSDGGRVQLIVSDSGVGIPAEELEKIFERFHRVQHTKGRSQEGTGIGLSLVQELVKLLGGKISVSSKPGEGAVFTVDLPLASEKNSTERSSEPRPHPVAPIPDNPYLREAEGWVSDVVLAGNAPGVAHFDNKGADIKGDKPSRRRLERVLLADDNADMREYVKRLLSVAYEVDVVNNGVQALASVIKHPPDLVISDVMMPEMNGFELVRELKKSDDTAQIPLILLSARAGEEATIEGLDAGADEYLVKPFAAKELLSRVRSAIKLAKTRRMAARNMYHVFMQTPVAVAVLKGNAFVFELINNKALEIVGKRHDEVINRPFLESLPELAAMGFEAILNGVYTTGETFYGNEMPLELNRFGRMETRVINFVFEPLRDEEENIAGIIASGTDVTDLVAGRKLIEESKEKLERLVAERTQELQAANLNLERSNVELEQFAHVASHDLKEPLRKIKTFANRLQEEHKDDMPEKAQTYLDKIQSSANRMYSMMEGVLIYSSIKGGQQGMAPVNLEDILSSIENDLEVVIHHKNAIIRKGALPVIEGAPVLIYQLFYNLINNSLKFSKPERQLIITINASIVNYNGVEHAEIVVADNGIGFNPVQSTNIFNTFTRLHSKDKYEGTGLGLALSKKIVERHHGTITATGVPDEGAVFTVSLPLKQ